MSEAIRTIYGDANGHWLVTSTPVGLITPPFVDVGLPPGQILRLQCLGTAPNVLTQIHNAHRGKKRPVQQALADMLGMKQQQVSRIVVGAEVRLRPEVVAKLVDAWFWPQHVEAAIASLMVGHFVAAARIARDVTYTGQDPADRKDQK